MRIIVGAIILAVLILGGVYRSALATRRDSFTIDEYYHITAGVSYARLGDYRVNPEHPPLVKVWTGWFFPPGSFQLPPLRPFNEKLDERRFTADVVYRKNDPDLVQQRARVAMFVLNGLLLFLLGLTILRIFGLFVAVMAMAVLIIDPTVSAHMPVVMTDLPFALLGAIAVLWSYAAFRSWRVYDTILAGVALGLSLATKHSALVIVEFVVLLGLFMLLRSFRKWTGRTLALRVLGIVTVLAVSWLLLWSVYGFRFTESNLAREVFNRPAASKVSDLHSAPLRVGMSWMLALQLAPRAYLWGLADTLRAGVEGRPYPIYFLDREYIRRVPLYYFPCQVLSKLPLGVVALALVGVGLLVLGRVSPAIREPLWVILAFGGFYLLTIALANSGYAGIRHALPVYITCSLFASTAVVAAVEKRSRVGMALIGAALTAAMISGLSVTRPWEYRNEMFGGPGGAYRLFSDEGVDLGQRTKELASYYHARLEPVRELPYVFYSYYLETEFQRRGIQTLNDYWDQHEADDTSDLIQGTVIVGANIVSAGSDVGLDPLRRLEPTERYGNLLIYRGAFRLPKQRAWRLYLRGLQGLYSPAGDVRRAELLFAEALQWNPESYCTAIELANLRAKRGAREEAIQTFEKALHSAAEQALRDAVTRQISLLRVQDPRAVTTLGDPCLE